MTGCVFNIQKFSIHDGPGIRTTVFLKGCPLRCLWCHNPEGLEPSPEIEFEPSKCIGCGACVSACPAGCQTMDEAGRGFDRSRCDRCGKCADVCLTGSLKRVGRRMTVGEVMAKVLDDRLFYETSGGGMTLSGGEPFFQPDFALALLEAAKKEGLHTALETSGFCSRAVLIKAVPLTDLFLFDYKATGDELHKRLTGVLQAPILENLRALSDAGAKILYRLSDHRRTSDHPRRERYGGALHRRRRAHGGPPRDRSGGPRSVSSPRHGQSPEDRENAGIPIRRPVKGAHGTDPRLHPITNKKAGQDFLIGFVVQYKSSSVRIPFSISLCVAFLIPDLSPG